MYREVISDDLAEIHSAFESALRRVEQGERLRLALSKDGDCYSLVASGSTEAGGGLLDESPLAQESM
jgi:hypothetical protein